MDCLVGSRRALWTSHLISLALSLPASLQSDAQIHFMLPFCKSLEVPDLQNAPGQTSQPVAINHFMSIKCTGTLFFLIKHINGAFISAFNLSLLFLSSAVTIQSFTSALFSPTLYLPQLITVCLPCNIYYTDMSWHCSIVSIYNYIW